MPSFEQISALLGAAYAFLTALAVIVPKGTALGKFLARIAGDVKGHNS